MIMHSAAAHGVTPKEPIEYMHYLRQRQEEKQQTEADVRGMWDGICKQREVEERARNGNG